MKREFVILLLFAVVFLVCWHLPIESLAESFGNEHVATQTAALLREYAREHVLLCLIPALFIAGGIVTFLDAQTVLRFLGPGARPTPAYAVSSVAGSVLAVCSCTILPLFAGIRRSGAGLGPATTFLYAGPAINVLAILLTARVLGVELGIARAVFAIVFGVLIGLLMQLLFRRSEARRATAPATTKTARTEADSLAGTLLVFAGLIGFLVFATWQDGGNAAFAAIARHRIPLALAALVISALAFLRWKRDRGTEWVEQSWTLGKQILPLLFLGVAASGVLFGTSQGAGLIPRAWITDAVGGNSVAANLVAASSGALMYFATLSEIPILEGLLAQGMGKGPALALLLAGPAVSLPSLLVIRSTLGWRKTLVFALLVVLLATLAGQLFGFLTSAGVSS